MSFESPESPRDAMEARLTALLLGELSAEEEGTLRAALAQDAALAQLYERLARTLGLVREAAGSLREETTPPAEALRLSAERREKLLQHFKVIPQSTLARTKRPSVNWREWAAVAAMLMGLIAIAAIHFAPNFTRARSAGPAVISAQRREELGLELADASDAVKSEHLVAGTVTRGRSEISKSAGSAHDVAPVTKFFDESAVPKKESTPPPSDPAGVSRGSEIALPQLGQAAGPAVRDGEAVVAFDSVTPADGLADLSAYSVASPEKKMGTIADRVAGQSQGFAGGGVGLGGAVAPAGAVSAHEFFAYSTGGGGQAGAKGDATTAGRPLSAVGFEFKSDIKAEVEKQSFFGTTDGGVRGADNRELSESVGRQQIAAVDTAWMAPAPTLSPAAPIVIPPPAPPVAVALEPATGLPVSADFVAADSGVTPQLAWKEQRDRYFADSEGKPASGPTPTPVPASRPTEPTAPPSADKPTTITTPTAPKTLAEISSLFAGTSFKKTASPKRKDNIASVVDEQEKLVASGGQVGDVALQQVNGNALNAPAIPGQKSDSRWDSTLDDSTKAGIRLDVTATNVAAVQFDKSSGESLGRFGNVALHERNLITSAPEPVESRSKRLAVVLPQQLGREADAKSEVQTQSGLVAGKPVRLENEVSERKRVDEFAALQKGLIVEEGRVLRRAPEAPVPQPEVSTVDNAFSTFSLNVSDVSFKLAAAALEQGKMPDVATIRSEEFINAFDYRDSEPGGSAPIAFAWERARYPFAHDRDLIRLSVKTAASGRQPGRPLNLVLLIDNSGSMERADRVRIRQECLRVLAGQLQPQDRVSVVSFARTARLWVDGLPGGQAGELPQRVGGLTPEGGTNLEEAMNLAYQTALRHFLANGVNRVVLLTDGAANLGDVQPGSLKKKVEAHRRQGVALDCFGIGWDGLNDELLEALSRNGDGRYGFVNTPEAAASEFAGQLAGALKVAASDVKVQVEWNPRRVTAYRQIGYAKHQLKKEQFRDNTVDAAEIGAAEAGNALYAVQVNPRGEGPLGTVRVRFKVPSSGDYREHEWPLDYDGSARPLEQSSAALRLAASAAAFSEWLVSSPFAGEVTPDKLLGYLGGVPETWPADPRPKKLEWMIRQAKSVSGK
ncbi:MAG: von Willebrand factor type A domain-containing protein [Verrucomicrobia bacterium]|nr:von Willebrand factor type A domain-containing protein [Verrucomicrobiota bacterium]